LFYQHNPYEASSLWGNISWGHAVSTDLAHWARLEPPPLQPSMPYDRNGIYSGSVTVRAVSRTIIAANLPSSQQ